MESGGAVALHAAVPVEPPLQVTVILPRSRDRAADASSMRDGSSVGGPIPPRCRRGCTCHARW